LLLITAESGIHSEEAWFKSGLKIFDSFRCRSAAAAGDLHFFVSPKQSKEKKGDPGAC
jgi:hypothetical protein